MVCTLTVLRTSNPQVLIRRLALHALNQQMSLLDHVEAVMLRHPLNLIVALLVDRVSTTGTAGTSALQG